ncbi:hypothetical protein [Desulfonema magnum]|uniref:Uncharacterized protein n=1 Tax=Desulfonema magnum TaxID=45655 RepID=A0A975BQX7_9BACT|nr:hypothetical protein [Desulfonema magnum]QTA90046.1 Uncharacterized protein dnm_061060 [Desulfonema magnum]
MQKTASLYFCTPEKKLCKKSLRSIFALREKNYAKNRFALFLHSGKKIMQKTASLYFCTPEKNYAKNRFALFLHSGKKIMQKIASLYFCTPEKKLCKKSLRSIFALRKKFLPYEIIGSVIVIKEIII